MNPVEQRPEKSPSLNHETMARDGALAAPSRNEITEWLATCKGADTQAIESLLPLVYDELHRQAVGFFVRERAGHTLQPTALVNEVYLRLVNQDGAKWKNRAQFFGIAAQ